MNQPFPPIDEVAQNEDNVVADLLDRAGSLMDRGELTAVEALIESHPKHAERLRRAIATIAALGACDGLSSETAAPGPSGLPLPLADHRLGDFRIRREVGRGGMGVVYEAVQISLGRRVALKVLPYAALLDTRQRERFLNEARVAAGLHHTHIVPVYTVGSERGVYFYAMQFIAGRDLADVIAELRKDAGNHGEPSAADPDAPTVRDEQALIETLRQRGDCRGLGLRRRH